MAQPTVEQILAATAQAAAAAADAAKSLRDYAQSAQGVDRQKFSEAAKVVKPPDVFGSENRDEDQKQWRDFILNFKSWLYYADSRFETELTYVENNAKAPVQLTTMSDEAKGRSMQLYSIFTGYLKGAALRLLRQQEDRNGMEVYRQLIQQFQPSSKARSLSLLQAFMQAPAFTKEKPMLEQVLGLERLRSEYQRCSGETVNDDLALSVLVRCLPNHIRQHVQLQMSDSTTYKTIRDYVLSYEVVTSSWTTAKVHSELGLVQSYSNSGSGVAPMEIDQIASKGKSKDGKGKYGKGKGKDKNGKGKGSGPWFSQSKSKGKGKDMNKGKQQHSGKGHGQGQQKLDPNQCSYCYAFGHRKFQCRKFQADKASGHIRQVNDESGSNADTTLPTAGSSATGSSVAGSSNSGNGGSSGSSGSGTGNIRKISSVTPFVHDMTALDEYFAERDLHSINMIQCCNSFDMSVTDGDGIWTYAPDLQSDMLHVRTVSSQHGPGAMVEILLDSGADSSVLPLDCEHLGESVDVDSAVHFVDAQGSPLGVKGKRVAELTLGHDIIIREQFIVAPVTGPIVCLVRLLKSGWEFSTIDGILHLCKDGHGFPVYFTKNSMYTQGIISKVSELGVDEPNVGSSSSINAIRLTSLANLQRGWNRLTEDVWALESFSATCVDTTLCPAPFLLWLRTTLVEYGSTGWEVVEYAQPISDLQDLELTVANRKDVKRMITIAHTYAVPSTFLGFEMDDVACPTSPRMTLGMHLERHAGDVVKADDEEVEVAVEVQDAPKAEGDEIPPEDRVVSAPTDGSVVVEGVRIDMSCPLRVVWTACESLGLSKRGSKKDNMMRLQKFVQHQTLLATHAASSTIDAEGRREVNVQAKPPCPTPDQIKSHNLTHEPYESWCELCVQFRARQDKHAAVDDSKTSTSLISFDFGYASRSAENVDKAVLLACHDKDTGLIGAIPSPAKGGKHFQFLVTELTRFVVATGHREVRMRCDGEPATLSILEACRKTCRALGISVSQETTSIGNHQGNGGAERTVEIVRSHASNVSLGIGTFSMDTQPLQGVNGTDTL